MSRRWSDPEGAALVLVLGWVSLLLPATLWIATAAWIELLQAQNARRATSAFYVAEAGLDRALAWVAQKRSAEEALRGPDGAQGTFDDGGVFGVPGQFIPFGPAGEGYEVTVSPVDATAVRVQSRGVGWGGGTRAVEAIVHWTQSGEVNVHWNEEFDL